MALEPPEEEEYTSLERGESVVAAMHASKAMLSPEGIWSRISVSLLQHDAARRDLRCSKAWCQAR
jgi:hypothetical protein